MAEILSYNHYRDMHDDVQLSAMFFGKNIQNIPFFSSTQTAVKEFDSYGLKVFTFTGKEKDSETGFSYFGARYYDSDLMTGWLSVDPLADKYPSLSPYAYCAWNPIRLVDPDGEELALNDDIVIKGANNSSITLKTDAVDFTINTNTDFGGNHEIEDLKNVAIGYEVGVNGTGAAGVGFSFSGYIQNVMFLGGEYAGYWYTYLGGETQMLASLAAEGTVGAQKNWFIAWCNPQNGKNNPSSFAGMYNGVNLGTDFNGLIGNAGINVSYSRSHKSENQNKTVWNMLSIGVSASIGPSFSLPMNFSVGSHIGGTKLLTAEIPTKERSWLDILSNHIINF